MSSSLVVEANPAAVPRVPSVVLTPHLNGIERECEKALQQLEQAGVRVVRRGGCSAIDVARNEMLSDALHDGAESMLFIDSDIGFDPQDALRLLARPEPVVSGVYAKKSKREMASVFADGVKEVLFGPEAAAPYPLKYAATGFLRLRAGVLRRMIAELKLAAVQHALGPRRLAVLPAADRAARPGQVALPRRRLGLQLPAGANRRHAAGRHDHPAVALGPLRLRLGRRRRRCETLSVV